MTVQHGEHERLVAQVEERFGLDPELVAPGLLEVAMPLPYAVVPFIDGAAGRRKARVDGNLGIAERDESPGVARVVCVYEAAVELDVLLGPPFSPLASR